jgi:hypothetical protein
MFGTSTHIHDYHRFIDSFNKKLNNIQGEYQLPLLPISEIKNKRSYFRFWVFKRVITVLYYPNYSLPRYDCETIKYYQNNDCGINLLVNSGSIIAIDGWKTNTMPKSTVSVYKKSRSEI